MNNELPESEQIALWQRQGRIHQEQGFHAGAAICFEEAERIAYGTRPLHELLSEIEVA